VNAIPDWSTSRLIVSKRTTTFAANRPFANPETAARKLVEIASGIEPVQDGRIYIERSTAPSCISSKARQRSTRPALIAQLPTAGYGCTRAGRT
jgi:hypothetical protein